ncbi:MAG: EB domain-containing protein [Candidatus Thermoplasmatota archaeon]|nr:EB domain-containing protein [Candidatus Thermoplasmatota archaeon]
MGQKPLLAFAIALILASSGCLGFGDDELEQQENEDEQETIDPVSTDNSTNQPPLVTAGIWMDDDDFLWSDDDMVYTKYVYVSWSAVDTDGNIASAGFDMDLDMQIDESVGSDSGTIIDSTSDSDHFPGALSMSLNEGWDFERQSPLDDDDRCFLVMHRTFAFVAEDDDGASSAQLIHLVADYYRWDANHMDNETIAILGLSSDDVDWVTGVSSDCSEPEEDDDNGGGPGQACTVDADCPPGTFCVGGICVEDTNICVDGDQMVDGGWTYTCVNGQWGPGEPVPDGTVCDDGDPYTENDAYYNGVCVGTPVVNHPPSINSLHFSPDPVTDETEFVCLQYDISDDDDDELEILVNWILDSDPKEELAAEECFNLSNYPVQSGMKLEAAVEVWDGEAVAQDSYTVSIVEA